MHHELSKLLGQHLRGDLGDPPPQLRVSLRSVEELPGIRVNAIAPSAVETPMLEAFAAANPSVRAQLVAMHPMKRIATADEIAESIAFLCSAAATSITGHTLVVDGGYVAA